MVALPCSLLSLFTSDAPSYIQHNFRYSLQARLRPACRFPPEILHPLFSARYPAAYPHHPFISYSSAFPSHFFLSSPIDIAINYFAAGSLTRILVCLSRFRISTNQQACLAVVAHPRRVLRHSPNTSISHLRPHVAQTHSKFDTLHDYFPTLVPTFIFLATSLCGASVAFKLRPRRSLSEFHRLYATNARINHPHLWSDQGSPRYHFRSTQTFDLQVAQFIRIGHCKSAIKDRISR